VAHRERLLIADKGRESVSGSNLDLAWLAEVRTHAPQERGIARIPADRAASLRDTYRDAIEIYVPLGAWREGRRDHWP
jgi:hypothetical protein